MNVIQKSEAIKNGLRKGFQDGSSKMAKRMLNVVSNENYAALLNAIMQQLGYPIPKKEQEEDTQKKAKSRAPQKKSSPERGSGLKPSQTTVFSANRPIKDGKELL